MSENANALFGRFVYSYTILKKFVDQFDNTLGGKVDNEQYANFNSFNATISYISICKIEKLI